MSHWCISDPRWPPGRKIMISLYLTYRDLSWPVLRTEWPDLDMPMQEPSLLWAIDARSPILNFRFKMAAWWENWDFPILNIWRPFRGQFSGPYDLTWTCLCQNISCYGPLVHVASFWISDPRWPTGGKIGISLYGDISGASSQDFMTWPRFAYARTFIAMGHWCM